MSRLQLLDVMGALGGLSLSAAQMKDLAFNLGVVQSKLDDIEGERKGDDRKRAYMQAWLDIDRDASWAKVVGALEKMGLKSQAATLARQKIPSSSASSSASNSSAGGKLQETVSDRDIVAIARDLISDWEALATYLQLNEAQKGNIRRSFPGDGERQARECLQKWKTANGNGATYQALISAAEEAKDQTLADGVITMCS